MKFEKTQVFNFEGAFRGLRNPLESWDKSDSQFCLTDIFMDDTLTEVCDAWIEYENVGRRERGAEELSYEMQNCQEYYEVLEKYENWLLHEGVLRQSDCGVNVYDVAFLGPNDLRLAQTLILAGSEHCKFMRQIFVSVDITAPILWFKEFDTYKIGTTANSTSTMHKLASRPITNNCFEFDNGDELEIKSYTIPHGGECGLVYSDYQEDIIDMCETLRQKYLETKDKRYWRALVQMLPESWLQTRTITMSYANLRNIYFQRRAHKLQEWCVFCDWIKSLPYGKELIILEDKNETN